MVCEARNNYHLRNKTNKRFAVISTLVRYWDLRYLDQNNFYHQSDKCKYLPDNYIVNGNISEINLLRNKFLKDKNDSNLKSLCKILDSKKSEIKTLKNKKIPHTFY